MAPPLILIADDDAGIRRLLSEVLTSEFGAHVVAASDGERLLELTRQIRPSVVVADVRMPRVGGLDVARRLRADPTTAGIPVVAVSAVAKRAECIDAGCVALLPKPFDLEDLIGAVGMHLPQQPADGRSRLRVLG